MLFHEMYGAYFRTVSLILQEAVDGGITEKRIREIVAEHAFAESTLVIPAKLVSGEWSLLTAAGKDGQGQRVWKSVLTDGPARPWSTLEKRWLAAVLADPRIKLFLTGKELHELGVMLGDTEPLFAPGDFVYYDRYEDGDPYTERKYIGIFRQVLRAMRERRMLSLQYTGRFGNVRHILCYPCKLEYSSKDDKFRVLTRSVKGIAYTINMARIQECRVKRAALPEEQAIPEMRKAFVDLELTDKRNALNRAMIHFSDLQKETEKVDEIHYRIRLYYYTDDETELVIRILSFGPMLRVLGPERFTEKIRERIIKQEEMCGLSL